MELKDILLAFQKSKRLSGRKFAETVGIASAQYNKYIMGKSVPTIAVLERIKNVFPDFDYSGNIIAFEPVMEYTTKSKNLPVFDLYAPVAKGKIQYSLKDAKVIDYFAIPIFNGALGYIQIKDESMKDLLNIGDYAAIIETQKKAVVFGEKYLIIFIDQKREPIIRFIRKGKTKDHWLLKCVNPNYDDFEVLISDVKYLYTIKGGVSARL